jgi:primosomal protein N' (replication factor Y)
MNNDRLICHYCGYTEKSPSICPKCGSNYIRHFGLGTQKVEDELKKILPGITVIRMDADTTYYKNSHRDILNRFKNENINVLVGTQMIAKGHDFPNVTLVGVIAADGILNIPDYRSSERTFQLLTQVSGRAGRAEKLGRAIIQTYSTEDYSIKASCKHDYIGFYEQEILIRKELGYPPFCNIAVITITGTDSSISFNSAKSVKDFICQDVEKNDSVNIVVLGPVKALIAKIKNRYRWKIIIKAQDEYSLIKILTDSYDWFCSKYKNNNIDINMDLNPYNML